MASTLVATKLSLPRLRGSLVPRPRLTALMDAGAEASLAALSEQSGLPLGQCEVHKHTLGGGFGRRGGAQDYVRQAVQIAKQFPGTPIKMIWSREEDMAHDFYRPISQKTSILCLER